MNIVHTLIKSNYIPDEIKPEDYLFGGGKFGGPILRPNGDWRDYLPKFEDQRKHNLETMACTVFGALNCVEILMEEMFGINDEDYSERFTGSLAGITKMGGSPQNVAETIRKFGVIPEALMPFSKDIDTWEKYYSPAGLKNIFEGAKWLNSWQFYHGWVFQFDMDITERNKVLMDALRYSPIGISVYAWQQINDVYFSEAGDTPNHWVTLVYGDKDYWYVFDNYAPYLKKLRKDIHFGQAKSYELVRASRPTNWFFDLLKRLIGL